VILCFSVIILDCALLANAAAQQTAFADGF